MSNYIFLLVNYFMDGGIWIMIPICAVSIIGWILIAEKYTHVNEVTRARKLFIRAVKEGKEYSIQNEEYSYLQKKIHARDFNQKSFYQFYREFLLNTIPKVDSSFSTINVWVSVSPLLGLLGTVSGMIETFKIIMEFGLGNPNLTAQGISIALITTQAGLFVAFPLIIAQNHVKNKAKKLKNSMFKDGEILIKQYEE